MLCIDFQTQVYTGNGDRNTIVVQDLEKATVALAVRLNPVEWHGHISLRMELYGCKSGNCSFKFKFGCLS